MRLFKTRRCLRSNYAPPRIGCHTLTVAKVQRPANCVTSFKLAQVTRSTCRPILDGLFLFAAERTSGSRPSGRSRMLAERTLR